MYKHSISCEVVVVRYGFFFADKVQKRAKGREIDRIMG